MALGRKTGGRKKGSLNKRTLERMAIERERLELIKVEGITPLEYMLEVMRDPKAPVYRRDEMAKAAAQYMHPRLNSVEIGGCVYAHDRMR